MRKVHHLMMGLPQAGKTTFLAAMWHVLCGDDVNGALKLVRFTGDREISIIQTIGISESVKI